MRLLTISGSLREGSSNNAVLRAAELLSPDGITFDHYDGVGTLPHFNPDLEAERPPEPVVMLRSRIGAADGVLISCPEYARGIPGSFKNALDWLVGSLEFPYKPVALINASPRATSAQAALRLVLTTMSAHLVEEASITLPLLGREIDAAGIAADPELSAPLAAALRTFRDAILAVSRALVLKE